MITKLSSINLRKLLFSAAIITISAGLCLGALPAFAQQDPPPPPPPPAQQSAPPVQQQGQQQQQAPPPDQQGGQQMGQQQDQAGPPQQQIPVPPSLNLPSGTLIKLRTNEGLSSEHSQVGDRFTASLSAPLIANGFVVARPGQLLNGRVVSVKKAGRVSGQSELGVEINELTLVDGQILPVKTSLVSYSGGTSYGRDAGTVVAPTALGAIIGGAAEGGGGAAVGAGIGAAAGILGVLVTRGNPTVLPPECLLTFRLESPVDISTANGQVAFQPVYQSDYGQDQDANSQQRQVVRRPAYGPYGPYAPYGPYYYGYAPYPAPYPYYASPFGYWGPYPFVAFTFRGGRWFRGSGRFR